jgi:uncharacterized protein YjbI with pentapeptide repeats
LSNFNTIYYKEESKMKKIILITMLMSAVFAQSDCNKDNWQEYYNSDGKDMSECELTNANLTGADLTNAILRGANLSGANLRDADLRVANLRDADLTNAILTDAKLSGAKLSGADLDGVISRGISGEPRSLPKGWSLVSGTLINDEGENLTPPDDMMADGDDPGGDNPDDMMTDGDDPGGDKPPMGDEPPMFSDGMTMTRDGILMAGDHLHLASECRDNEMAGDHVHLAPDCSKFEDSVGAGSMSFFDNELGPQAVNKPCGDRKGNLIFRTICNIPNAESQTISLPYGRGADCFGLEALSGEIAFEIVSEDGTHIFDTSMGNEAFIGLKLEGPGVFTIKSIDGSPDGSVTVKFTEVPLD